ncbi:hypothetical protein ACLGGT_10575 [Roseovarius sp. MS2]|uniref:hypothetical protein n=1 Tax=Roseovarius sp. MS2 TaxID=3390728 RepID=UPI003EDC0CA4
MTIERVTNSNDVRAVLKRLNEESARQLDVMRGVALKRLVGNTNIIVGLNGSVARREVTSGSDVDLFFLTLDDDVESARRVQDDYRSDLRALGIKMPANDGVFEAPLAVSELLANIGGDKDTNEYLTRRMLYLLEGDWLHNQSGFDRVRAQLIEHYVDEDLEDRKLCRYLLNDIIRYWRTICVDFEEKTGNGEKPRAVRLVKLRFARMMLYFGGIAAISRTGDVSPPEKRSILLEMFSKPPIDRLIEVFGEEESARALSAYATFLNAMDSKSVRAKLDQEGFTGLETDEYRELVVVARDFRNSLEGLLVDKSGLRHRIASAMLL